MKTSRIAALAVFVGLFLVLAAVQSPGDAPVWAAQEHHEYMPFFRIDFSCFNVTEIPLEECRALVDLYYTTGGDGWTAKTNWMENYSPGTWEGVTVSEGTVISLTLPASNLTGTLPVNLGDLAGLREVDLSGNQVNGGLDALLGAGAPAGLQKIDLHDNPLAGNVPLEIVNLARVDRFHFYDTGLCEPETPEYLAWKATVEDYQGTGTICSYCSLYYPGNAQCEALAALYASTGGDGWTDHTGWLEDPDLENWYGVEECDSGTSVCYLHLRENNLVGTLPPEIGDLTSLVALELNYNSITGTIPAEIGLLDACAFVHLEHNQLSGGIPPEVGDMGYLWFLYLDHNQLSGEIPVELEQLSYINEIYLNNNQLTGNIPAGLFPAGAGSLDVSFNPLMSGSVPLSFIEKTLYLFHFNETGICEPGTPEYLAWKAAVPDYVGTGATCTR